MKYILPCSLWILLIACNNTEQARQPASLVKSVDSTVPKGQTDSVPVTAAPGPVDTVPHNIQVDTVIHLSFAKDSTTLTATGSLNKKSTPVICYLPVDRHVALNARIIPRNKELNVRFSQIVLPDGNSDGPFGLQIKYELRQMGLYKLIIGPNLMADGKRSGDFIIRLETKKRS
jgi:hypothetical protein